METKIYRIQTGEHLSTPIQIQPFVKKISGTVTFPSPFYDLNDNDQYDWNKLVGISFNVFKPDQNAIMIGWRYNLDTNKIEVGPYFNANSERITPEKLQPTQQYWISVTPETPIKFEITYNEVKFWNTLSGQFMIVSTPPSVRTKFWKSFMVQPWFGGNRTAPNPIKIQMGYEITR